MTSSFNLHDIATFLAIADCGSLTQAADRLGLSKSIVSKRLKRLEEMLGVALLHRSTRGVTTTVQGQAFHARASAILQELEAAVREHGIESIEKVDLAMLEVDGNISVLSEDFKKKTRKTINN